MALIDVYHAAVADSQVKQRVIGAALIAAGDIRNEDAGTANHANRLIWADRVNADPVATGTELFNYMLRDAVVLNAISTQATVNDADVQNAVNGYVDSVATGV